MVLLKRCICTSRAVDGAAANAFDATFPPMPFGREKKKPTKTKHKMHFSSRFLVTWPRPPFTSPPPTPRPDACFLCVLCCPCDIQCPVSNVHASQRAHTRARINSIFLPSSGDTMKYCDSSQGDFGRFEFGGPSMGLLLLHAHTHRNRRVACARSRERCPGRPNAKLWPNLLDARCRPLSPQSPGSGAKVHGSRIN